MEELKKERPKLSQIDLLDFLTSYLRIDEHKDLGPFSYLAEVIEIKLGNTCLFKVVTYPNEIHPDWRGIHLWNFKAWKEDHNRWQFERDRSERQRIEKYIFDENVDRLSRKLCRYAYLDQDVAIRLASDLIRGKKTQAIEAVGGKLITKVEEI